MLTFSLLFLLFASVSEECQPTVPVGTTTISPISSTASTPTNTTSISSTTPISTSTLISTTTDNGCCTYPVRTTRINTAVPTSQAWDNCSQTVTFNCSATLSNFQVGIAVNIGDNTTVVPTENVILISANHDNLAAAMVVILTCDSTDHLWRINGSAVHYSIFGCVYSPLNSSTWAFS